MRRRISILVTVLLLTLSFAGCFGTDSGGTKSIEVINIETVSEQILSTTVRGFSVEIKNNGEQSIDDLKIEFSIYKTAAKEELRTDKGTFVLNLPDKFKPFGPGDIVTIENKTDDFNSFIEYYDYEVIY